MSWRRGLILLHLAVLLAWGGSVLYLAITTTLMGTEENRLRLQMGADRQARKQLIYERERIQADLDRAQQPALLRAAIKRLELPLEERTQRLADNQGGDARGR